MAEPTEKKIKEDFNAAIHANNVDAAKVFLISNRWIFPKTKQVLHCLMHNRRSMLNLLLNASGAKPAPMQELIDVMWKKTIVQETWMTFVESYRFMYESLAQQLFYVALDRNWVPLAHWAIEHCGHFGPDMPAYTTDDSDDESFKSGLMLENAFKFNNEDLLVHTLPQFLNRQRPSAKKRAVQRIKTRAVKRGWVRTLKQLNAVDDTYSRTMVEKIDAQIQKYMQIRQAMIKIAE